MQILVTGSAKGDLDDLLAFGGFPEPFLAANETATRRWSREYRTRLVEDGRPLQFIECKSAGRGASRSLFYLKARFPEVAAFLAGLV